MKKNKFNKFFSLLAVIAFLIGVYFPSIASAVRPETIKICHSTASHSNPYIVNNPAKSGDVSGHDGHDGPIWFPGITVEWGDIIPPFDYDGGSYPGKNWDATGQIIYANDCDISGPTPTPTATPTATPTVTPSPLPGVLGIAKSNDKSGGASAEEIVNYTLVITNTGGQDAKVDVTDVLPGGFTYVLNSAMVGGSPQEPNMSDPGKLVWEAVSVLTSSPTAITYQALIASDISQGIYTNLATCKGFPMGEAFREVVFIAVECNVADSSVPIGVAFTYSDGLRGEVLGITTELPATGNDTKVLIMLLTMLALGASLKVVSYNMAEKKEGKNV